VPELDEVVGQGSALVAHPCGKCREQRPLVDQAVLQGQQAEEQVAGQSTRPIDPSSRALGRFLFRVVRGRAGAEQVPMSAMVRGELDSEGLMVAPGRHAVDDVPIRVERQELQAGGPWRPAGRSSRFKRLRSCLSGPAQVSARRRSGFRA